ncbi:MAG: hypothetical protein ACRD8Z_21495, partial [Nitrososphaeraceae archaeon]
MRINERDVVWTNSGVSLHLFLSCSVTVIALVFLFVPSIAITSHAQELREEDYAIIDFGLINRNTPFITVEGKAGG